MLINLLLGVTTMVCCLLLQSLLLLAAVRYYVRHEYLVNSPSFISSIVVINSVMLMLLLGNLAQVAIWAVLFQWLGEFDLFQTAFYHSAVNFATLGYGDIVVSERYRLLGPLEAINGVLMIGISTAMLMSTFHDAIRKTIRARTG
jgi:hypothetical protein